jgi:hypothetical protein
MFCIDTTEKKKEYFVVNDNHIVLPKKVSRYFDLMSFSSAPDSQILSSIYSIGAQLRERIPIYFTEILQVVEKTYEIDPEKMNERIIHCAYNHP